MVSRPARTLGFLLALGIGGVIVLGLIADRYRVTLEQADSTSQELRQTVDRFIQVRRGMWFEVETWKTGESRPAALRMARDRGCLRYELDAGSYGEVRRQYRAWKAGELDAASPMAAALRQRRVELEQLELGDYESLDR